jgi:xylan 1,4-beta-xylosidase
LLAEGGTGIGHAASVARSRSIDGHYELHPHNPLITSYGHPELRLQRAGHGSWCDSPDGRTYMAFLCGRFLPGTANCILGRETAIVELEWQNDWPYVIPEPGTPKISNGHIWNFPTDTFSPPAANASPQKNEERIYWFKDGIHDDFKNLRVQRESALYSTSARPGYLRLKGGQSPASRFRQTLLARRQQHFSFAAETKMEFAPGAFQEFAGLCWRYDEARQYLLAVSWNEELDGRTLAVISMNSGQFTRSHETALPPAGPVWLGLTVRGGQGMFRYSLDGTVWNEVRPVLEAAAFCNGGFTGPFTGIFCADIARYTATADFEYFAYTPLDEQ